MIHLLVNSNHDFNRFNRAVLVREIAKTKERKKAKKPTEAKRRGTIKPARLGKKIQKEQEKPAGDVEQKTESRKV